MYVGIYVCNNKVSAFRRSSLLSPRSHQQSQFHGILNRSLSISLSRVFTHSTFQRFCCFFVVFAHTSDQLFIQRLLVAYFYKKSPIFLCFFVPCISFEIHIVSLSSAKLITIFFSYKIHLCIVVK